jgi:hypothetical protein
VENKTIVPRFRGLAVQDGSQWFWELMITIGPEEHVEPITMRSDKSTPFLNKESALSDLRRQLQDIMTVVCEAIGAPPPDTIMDLKAGVAIAAEAYFDSVHKH